MLLILGGLLLTVAAIVFTVVSWGHIGIGGRAAILSAITGVTLAVPLLLVKRGLTATAETIGALGLALVLLDGYAARRVGLLDGLAGEDYAALLIGVVAVAAVGYSRVLPLRLPMPLAIGLAQVPLPLFAVDEPRGVLVGAFVVTAAMDAAIWAYNKQRFVAETAASFLGITGVIGLLLGMGFAMTDDAVGPALGLVGFAAIGVFVALRTTDVVSMVALAPAALAATMAIGAVVRPSLVFEWQAVPFVVAGLIVGALAFLLPVRLRLGGAVTGGALAVIATLPMVPSAVGVLARPILLLDQAWSGGVEYASPWVRPAVVSFLLLAAACRVVERWRANPGALVFGAVAVLLAPVAYGLGYVAAVGVPLVLAVLLTVMATRRKEAVWVAGFAGVEAVGWAVASEPATYVVLAVLFAVWAVFFRRAAALVGAALAGGGLVWAVLAGLELPVLDSLSTGLAVAGALALAGWYIAEGRTKAEGFGRVLAVVLAGLSVLPVLEVLQGVLVLYGQYAVPWEGPSVLTWQRPLVLVAVALAGAVVALAMRRLAAWLVAGSIVLAVLVIAVRLPYAVMVVVLVAGTAAVVAAAVRVRRDAQVVTATAIWLGTLAIGAALAEQAATLAVLPVLAVTALAAALLGRARHLATVLAALLAAGEVVAVWQAVDLRAASLVCAGAGVVAVAAGVVGKSRPLGYLGSAFLLTASWLRLWAEGVEVVEAYTLPFSLVLLGLGWWNARGRQVNSWRAYGAGLLFTFAPSLLAEPVALRSLLLGTAALAVTLVGARSRLQAPAVLGAAALTIVAVRELAPWIADLVSALPRWVPIAVGGLLLVVIGATYEARKRDVIRIKDAVARLR